MLRKLIKSVRSKVAQSKAKNSKASQSKAARAKAPQSKAARAKAPRSKVAQSKVARSKAALKKVASVLKKKIKPKKQTAEDQIKSMPVHVVQEFNQDSNEELVPEAVPQFTPQVLPQVFREPDIPDTPYLNFQLWTKISVNLPPDYKLPNPDSVDLLFPKASDYYRNLFALASKNQHVMVDDQVWRRIKEALPGDFQIPDSRLTSDLK
ncbi:hypothetical protein D7Z26_06170 [Cohnella endophytica]|uniref:Uncharacterized protein n=1 Tax=Cohnella endophytica TaxID=2419778 RepID=A0A494Y8H5_9BACL|nr:hypothetical protein [Cohnella endophytica]RKP56222.1 hypothetical protein D7Z26_06170 [Cohnella endophytica]